jgi:uncharacterized membrane protein YfcA
MIDSLLYLLLGVGMGTLGGVFGIGGGLIAIPALALLLGMNQQLAQGTALVMVVPNVLLATWRYHQRTPIDPRHAVALGAAGFCMAWLGSSVAVRLDAEAMRVGFALFMLALAAYNYGQMRLPKPSPSTRLRYGWPWLAGLGGASGLLGGFFGVGGAVLATPVLTSVFGTTQVVAQGLSLALAAPSTAVTLATYAWHEHVDWAVGVPLALGGLLSVSAGVRLAYSLPERTLRTAFCVFLVICAGLLLVKA